MIEYDPDGHSGDTYESASGDIGEAAEISRIIGSFDGRLTEAEKRIDRVLARLGVE